MNCTDGISILKNPVRTYSWGSGTALQTLLGRPEAIGKPMAELWMGSHPGAPSMVMKDGQWTPLGEIVRAAPESVLGKGVSRAFSRRLPFLFKVLGVGSPLSMQVHPDLRQAGEGYARENRMGMALDAPERNYRDENHKPEIICALTPFRLLTGFREMEEIRRLMGEILPSTLFAEMPFAAGRLRSEEIRPLFDSLMTMEEHKRRALVDEAAKAARARVAESPLFYWVSELASAYPGDMGVLSPLIMNFEELKPGEAIYIPPGELHAYLDGSGIELMANSDNVLRGGLTSKHVDMRELLRVVDFSPGGAKRVLPVARGECERAYPTPAREFLLSVISLDKRMPYTASGRRSVEILICTQGEAEVAGTGNDAPLRIGRGDAVFVPGTVLQYGIEGDATLYKASVPILQDSKEIEN
ncbi:MAG: mannose-6-phosphate isomerase, class I [Deltaproteobacteria bacterium]|nr:mannose-6-phosphate isomerase, class I [Deltaproteobacteria bacterium]